MTSKYVRSEIFKFYELPEEVKTEMTKEMDFLEKDELSEESFVKDPCNEKEYLPLSMFVRTEIFQEPKRRKNNFTHGIYGLTAFSCYTITLSRSNDCATVAYKHF